VARANLVEKILKACRADPVASRGGPVVVAVSGGPDSSALLHAMARTAPRLGLTLTAAHLDHGLRPGSAGDARHVARLCESLGVGLRSERRMVTGKGEEAARDARHRFLDEVAEDKGAATIAYGHTADDQAETVLLHLVRGTGLEGLAAMAPRDGRRFRPMLAVTRQEVEAYCGRTLLQPLRDPTNRDLRITRNAVRSQLMPLLETLNPQVRDSLVRMAEVARQEHDVVAQAAARWQRANTQPFNRERFNRLPRAVRAEVVRRAWAAAADLDGLLPGGFEKLGQALDRVERPGTGVFQLGKGVRLHVRPGSFEISR
jgi:tRNA(Ile)-lysidine synthase